MAMVSMDSQESGWIETRKILIHMAQRLPQTLACIGENRILIEWPLNYRIGAPSHQSLKSLL